MEWLQKWQVRSVEFLSPTTFYILYLKVTLARRFIVLKAKKKRSSKRLYGICRIYVYSVIQKSKPRMTSLLLWIGVYAFRMDIDFFLL